MKMFPLIIEIIGILLRILVGVLLLVLYVGLRAHIDSWFIALLSKLFLIGLGATAIVLGFLRLHSFVRQKAEKKKKS